MDCLPGSSIHGIFQARILEWVAISFSRVSSRPRDWTEVSCIVGRCFTVWATREELIHPNKCVFLYKKDLQSHVSKSWVFKTIQINISKLWEINLWFLVNKYTSFIIMMRFRVYVDLVYISVQLGHSVVSNSLRPYGLQHTRLPCPLPTPRACSNSCPWVRDAISSTYLWIFWSILSYMCKQYDCLSQMVLYLCNTFVSKISFFFSSAVEVLNLEILNITWSRRPKDTETSTGSILLVLLKQTNTKLTKREYSTETNNCIFLMKALFANTLMPGNTWFASTIECLNSHL